MIDPSRALVCAFLLVAACADRPNPRQPEPPAPESSADDPRDIEDAEIGEEQTDDAQAVEPGPAEREVGMPPE